MATPNYSYEKRQRELAKKRKAEEKRQKKAHRDTDGGAPAPDEAADNADNTATDGPDAPPPGTSGTA